MPGGVTHLSLPLRCACRYKRADTVRYLLLEGADHTISGAGWSPRGVARIYNYKPVLAVLDVSTT